MKRYRGFTMMEMSVVISLCMVLLGLTAILFTTSTRLIKAQHTIGPQLAQFDAMIDLLREDVWESKTCEIKPDGSLVLVMSEQPVTWQKDADSGQIVRRQDEHHRYYPRQQVTLRFEAISAGITLAIQTPEDTRPITMSLLSRHMLKEAQDVH